MTNCTRWETHFWDIVEEAAAIPGAARVAETSTCHSKLYLYYKIIQYNEASGGDRASAERDLNRKHLQPIRFVPVFGLELCVPVRPALRTAPN